MITSVTDVTAARGTVMTLERGQFLSFVRLLRKRGTVPFSFAPN